jgi:hypothetical protein
MYITATALAIVLAVLLAGCMLLENKGTPRSEQPAAAKNERLPRTDTFVLQGTVVKKDLEGGFFAIDGDDGKTYEPLNLPEAFQNNGMRIKATVRVRDDVGSIHMVGEIIEIEDIKAE